MFSSIPKMLPKPNKKMQRVQKQRRQQLKTVVNDLSSIAVKEIERFNEFATEFLTEEADNPIILEQGEEQEDHEEEISV